MHWAEPSKRKHMLRRSLVVALSILGVAAGLTGVAIQLAVAGGGSYGDVFVVLTLAAIITVGWAAAATFRFTRHRAGAPLALAASAVATVALAVLALAIGLRG